MKQAVTQMQRKGDGGISNSVEAAGGRKLCDRGFGQRKLAYSDGSTFGYNALGENHADFPAMLTHKCWKTDMRTGTQHEHSHTTALQFQYSLPAVPCTWMLMQPQEHGKKGSEQ